MPHAPYGAGLARCELFEQDGVLVAQGPATEHGQTIHVLTLDQRYELATLMLPAGYHPTSAILWRTTRGDQITPPTLDAVIAAVHETFGANPRYRTGAP